MQGVGETLRGTLNSTVDRRFPSKNAEKAARTNAKNEEILERGRAEMEGIPGGWPSHENEHPAYRQTETSDVLHDPIPPDTGRATSPATEDKKGFRKLFKRKPVAEQGMAR
jgi:hypothetical protein